jgi:nuclear-control-of-ATPase protein 2
MWQKNVVAFTELTKHTLLYELCRYFFRALYNIRAKDLRPVTAVHGEMSHYLNKMENVLLLSDKADMQGEDGKSSRGRTSTRTTGYRATGLKPSELGEFLLNMHRYLILLDFSSPPFPAWSCDQIHSSLQHFFGSGGTLERLDCDRQMQWLSRIKQKHQDLVKSL